MNEIRKSQLLQQFDFKPTLSHAKFGGAQFDNQKYVNPGAMPTYRTIGGMNTLNPNKHKIEQLERKEIVNDIVEYAFERSSQTVSKEEALMISNKVKLALKQIEGGISLKEISNHIKNFANIVNKNSGKVEKIATNVSNVSNKVGRVANKVGRVSRKVERVAKKGEPIAKSVGRVLAPVALDVGVDLGSKALANAILDPLGMPEFVPLAGKVTNKIVRKVIKNKTGLGVGQYKKGGNKKAGCNDCKKKGGATVDKRKIRGQVIKKLMKEHNMSFIEASKSATNYMKKNI